MLTIPKCISRSSFEKNQELYPRYAIMHYPWAPEEGAYKPEAFIRTAHSGSCLFVRMWCRESDPRAEVHEWNGPVWTDSALEFFIEPVRGKGYFNFEMNSYPALLAYYGVSTNDEQRIPVEWPREDFELKSRRWHHGEHDFWEVCLTIPFAALQKYVPEFRPLPGTVIRVNAYKCGDACAEPHYGCLFPIDPVQVPDAAFHVPDYFGEMCLL